MRTRVHRAAVVGGAVLAYTALQQLVFTLSYLNGLPLDQVFLTLSGWAGVLFSQYLPFSVGVFACLWLLTPISAESSLASVIRRSVLAAGIGAVLVILVRTVVSSASAFAGVGSFFGNSFPSLPFDSILWAFGYGIQTGLASFLQLLPLVMLVMVFAWMWLVRHPSQHSVEPPAAEV